MFLDSRTLLLIDLCIDQLIEKYNTSPADFYELFPNLTCKNTYIMGES